jgi:hypothetical protein
MRVDYPADAEAIEAYSTKSAPELRCEGHHVGRSSARLSKILCAFATSSNSRLIVALFPMRVLRPMDSSMSVPMRTVPSEDLQLDVRHAVEIVLRNRRSAGVSRDVSHPLQASGLGAEDRPIAGEWLFRLPHDMEVDAGSLHAWASSRSEQRSSATARSKRIAQRNRHRRGSRVAHHGARMSSPDGPQRSLTDERSRCTVTSCCAHTS